jgi:hypothetical protein
MPVQYRDESLFQLVGFLSVVAPFDPKVAMACGFSSESMPALISMEGVGTSGHHPFTCYRSMLSAFGISIIADQVSTRCT